MNMEPSPRVNQPKFSEIIRQFVDQAERMFLCELEFQSAKGQPLPSAQFLLKGAVYWAVEILGINIKSQLLAKRFA